MTEWQDDAKEMLDEAGFPILYITRPAWGPGYNGGGGDQPETSKQVTAYVGPITERQSKDKVKAHQSKILIAALDLPKVEENAYFIIGTNPETDAKVSVGTVRTHRGEDGESVLHEITATYGPEKWRQDAF